MDGKERKERKRGSIVGPVILIGLGVIFLLNNLGIVKWDIWDVILRLWPILLVAAGLDILIGRRSAWGALLSLILTIALVAGALWLFGTGIIGQDTSAQEISQELGDASRADITIGPAVGVLRIEALSEPGILASGVINTTSNEQVTRDFTHRGQTAVFALQSGGSFVGYQALSRTHIWDLGLNSDIPMELSTSLGVGEADFDLRGLAITSLDASLGVGQMTIILPDEGRLEAAIDGAIGHTTIIIPADVAVRIDFSMALAGRDVPESFERFEDTYTSPGYQSADNRVDLDVSQAIGSVTIRHLGEE